MAAEVMAPGAPGAQGPKEEEAVAVEQVVVAEVPRSSEVRNLSYLGTSARVGADCSTDPESHVAPIEPPNR